MEQSGFIQLFSRRSHNGKNPWKIGWLLCAGWAGHSHRAEVWKTLSHNKGEGHSPIPALGESPLRFMFDRSGRKIVTGGDRQLEACPGKHGAGFFTGLSTLCGGDGEVG